MIDPRKVTKIQSLLLLPLAAIYFVSMFVYPVLNAWSWQGTVQGSIQHVWEHAESVWHDWQSLNVGVLAFAASVVAFNIARFNAEQQKKRDFVAARAFLPEALDELTGYLQYCAFFLDSRWRNFDRLDVEENQDEDTVALPELPASYRPIFKDCIRSANPKVGYYLSSILRDLQILQARINSFRRDQEHPDSVHIVTRSNILEYLYNVGVLQARINKIFEFSRGIGEFDDSQITQDEVLTGLGNLKVVPERYPTFREEVISRAPPRL